VTIRERSTTFDESQVKTPFKKQKPTTKKKQIEKHEKHGKQEKYEKDEERTSKLPRTKVHHDTLTYNAWNKKRRHKYHCADPFRFDPRYKKRKKPGRKDGTIVVPQQKQKKTNDSLLYDAWSKKRKHKKKRS